MRSDVQRGVTCEVRAVRRGPRIQERRHQPREAVLRGGVEGLPLQVPHSEAHIRAPPQDLQGFPLVDTQRHVRSPAVLLAAPTVLLHRLAIARGCHRPLSLQGAQQPPEFPGGLPLPNRVCSGVRSFDSRLDPRLSPPWVSQQQRAKLHIQSTLDVLPASLEHLLDVQGRGRQCKRRCRGRRRLPRQVVEVEEASAAAHGGRLCCLAGRSGMPALDFLESRQSSTSGNLTLQIRCKLLLGHPSHAKAPRRASAAQQNERARRRFAHSLARP
mmetsp:Transcript_39421/g.111664  ORF Transcript_39421/g.111664 Transcript_39421/m.111664 type:complete len:271 (+) Transcript_39421:587-1399(+)